MSDRVKTPDFPSSHSAASTAPRANPARLRGHVTQLDPVVRALDSDRVDSRHRADARHGHLERLRIDRCTLGKLRCPAALPIQLLNDELREPARGSTRMVGLEAMVALEEVDVVFAEPVHASHGIAYDAGEEEHPNGEVRRVQ